MPMPEIAVQNFEQRLVAMAEHFDDFLQIYTREHPSVFRDRIPRTAMDLFQGLLQKTNIWHAGLGVQAGLADWKPIQVSQVADGTELGVNACSYTPQTYDFAVESKQYSGLNTSWRSPMVCVNDVMWTDEGREQVTQIMGMGTMISASNWENFSREFYVKFAVDSGNGYVLMEGGLLENNPKFTYDPFTSYSRVTSFGATEKFTVLKLTPGLDVSTLNFSYLDLFSSYLGDECPNAAINKQSGYPIFGLMIHKLDLDRAIKADPEWREDIRFAQPQMLIENYPMTFPLYRGYAIMHDPRQMRFKYWKIGTDGLAWYRRVLPMREGRQVTIGRLPEANPEYQTAEMALGVIFMNNVYQIRVPPSVSSLGGGTVFGPAPGYNGDWKWINGYDKQDNPLQEVGYFFMRCAAFPKPLLYSGRAHVFLYRRCAQTVFTKCDLGESVIAGATEAVTLASAAASTALDATNRTVTVTLSKRLPCGVNSLVNIVNASAATATGYIASDASAPTYVIGFTVAEYDGDVDGAADWTTASTVACA